MANTAQNLLISPDPSIFRTIFLYVGQGDATLYIIPSDNGKTIFALVDINLDATRGGIDVVRLLEDLLPMDNDGRPVLDIYINTHPHNDHIRGLDKLRERIRVRQVWQTGFQPGKEHADTYKNFEALLKQVEAEGGTVWEYQGTRGKKKIGQVEVEILSPAQYVKDEIDELSGDERYRRIHEYCGVFRFGYGQPPRYVLQPGDADRAAWEKHILGDSEYHATRIPADVLSASHHGSRTFFYYGDPENEEPYTRALELIDPTWLVISSPKQSESPHGHPHDEALSIYCEYVDEQNIKVLGEQRESVIYDIYADGSHSFYTDRGRLANDYSLDNGKDEGSKGGAPLYVPTRIDRGRPMG